MKLAWIDTRRLGDLARPVIEESVHAGVAGFLCDDPALVADLPPTVRKIGLVTLDTPKASVPDLAAAVDVLIVDYRLAGQITPESTAVETGVMVTVTGEETLSIACRWAAEADWTLVEFQQDPSKIPLEILLAAADKAPGNLITVVEDIADAAVTFGVLERGSEGVLLAPSAVGEATELVKICHGGDSKLALQQLEVVELTHLGLGDRVCIDTCSHMQQNEGILVGSYATGMILVSSETHPLPYMATRPFRVNAAALHSYTLTPNNRTRYLAELHSGSEILAVTTEGRARRIVVGRIKMETRPLLRIQARAANGQMVDLIAQDDWHVRALDADGGVRNITELRPGDTVLGHTLSDQRHVGYPIREFLHEQ
ncbi:3-dehydroquinate synthase II family protein [Amycolatopsis sp. NPDC021455]|uniref:3-dehydroquinate synthase II family protein n=1 Tax=Amycolatopsis sp. NPDC021455 TaxID=3154901 RepID=UPI0033FB91BF